MNQRERVQRALDPGEPDRVPFCEIYADRGIMGDVLGRRFERAPDLETNASTVEEEKEFAEALGMDNIRYVLRAPIFTRKDPGKDGRKFYDEGLIKTRDDLGLLKGLPDPTSDEFYEDAQRFAEQKGDYSCWLVTRAGIYPAMLSMGIENFCVSLYDDRALVERVLDAYCEWEVQVLERACRLPFDVVCSTDDFAGKSGPLFSPEVFHELMMPRMRMVAEKVTLPWILHSDGNNLPLMDDIVSLGINAIHPNEKGAQDIRRVKREYGDRVCVFGNVDINLLGMATPERVDEEVRGLIRDVAPGGGYMVSSGNSLTDYCRLENVRAMASAVAKYGRYPIRV